MTYWRATSTSRRRRCRCLLTVYYLSKSTLSSVEAWLRDSPRKRFPIPQRHGDVSTEVWRHAAVDMLDSRWIKQENKRIFYKLLFIFYFLIISFISHINMSTRRTPWRSLLLSWCCTKMGTRSLFASRNPVQPCCLGSSRVYPATRRQNRGHLLLEYQGISRTEREEINNWMS